MTAQAGDMPVTEPGGYDYRLVNGPPPDRLVCIICQLPSRDPHLTDCCGVIYCKSCLERAQQKTTVSTACAHCRAEKFNSMINKQANREIKSLRIYCTNKGKGCKWQCELKDINNHLGNSDGCQFEKVKCSNECGVMIERRKLTGHVETECPRRNATCDYCRGIGAYQFIKGQHKEKCPKLPLPCPFKCGCVNISRDKLNNHIGVCSLQKIPCEFHSVGCEAIISRKEQKVHNDEMRDTHRLLLQELENRRLQELENRRSGEIKIWLMMIGLAGISVGAWVFRYLK